MSPLIFATAVFAALSIRRCPRCGHKHHVPRKDASRTVRCKNCGNEMPPRRLADPREGR